MSGRKCVVVDGAGTVLSLIEPQLALQTALAWTPDGESLVLGHRDGTVSLWDVGTQELLARYKPHTEGVEGLAVAPDGRRVASTSIDRTVAIWPLDPIQMAREFGVRDLTMAERQRFDLMEPVHEQTKAWVDGLYQSAILTREVLDRIVQGQEAPLGVESSIARAYALERRNPPAQALHTQASGVLYDPESGMDRVRMALRRMRAASRLQPRHANHLILAALGEYRMGEYHLSLQTLERAFEQDGPALEGLGWAIRSLAFVALERMPEARSAAMRISAGGPGGPRPQSGPGEREGGPHQGRAQGPQQRPQQGPQQRAGVPGARGRLFWIAEARRQLR